jgi:hypothetical protein
MVTSIKRSSGFFLFRTLLFFVKRKAVEYCEQLLNSKYTAVFHAGITEQLKKKNEVLQTRVRRIIEEKRKHDEATACPSTLSCFPRIGIDALTHDSKPTVEVIVKSSRVTPARGNYRPRRVEFSCLDVRPQANRACACPFSGRQARLDRA